MKSLLKAAVAASALMLASPALADITINAASDDQGVLVHGTGVEQNGPTVTGALGAIMRPVQGFVLSLIPFVLSILP